MYLYVPDSFLVGSETQVFKARKEKAMRCLVPCKDYRVPRRHHDCDWWQADCWYWCEWRVVSFTQRSAGRPQWHSISTPPVWTASEGNKEAYGFDSHSECHKAHYCEPQPQCDLLTPSEYSRVALFYTVWYYVVVDCCNCSGRHRHRISKRCWITKIQTSLHTVEVEDEGFQ